MSVIEWIIDTFARTEIIDLNFVVSDLKDIPISEAERIESSFYDSMCNDMTGSDGYTPSNPNLKVY